MLIDHTCPASFTMALGCYSYFADTARTLNHIACSGIHYKHVLKGRVGIFVDQFFNATCEDRCLNENHR